jgi:hypothetical protein
MNFGTKNRVSLLCATIASCSQHTKGQKLAATVRKMIAFHNSLIPPSAALFMARLSRNRLRQLLRKTGRPPMVLAIRARIGTPGTPKSRKPVTELEVRRFVDQYEMQRAHEKSQD